MYLRREYIVEALRFLLPDGEALQFSYEGHDKVDISLEADTLGPMIKDSAICRATTQQELSDVLAQQIASQQPISEDSLPFLQELGFYVKKTIDFLRWRCGVRGPHNPIRPGKIEWSMNNETWYPVVLHITLSPANSVILRVRDHIRKEIEDYAKDDRLRIVSHELFQEAWEQRHMNPRSALVIGIAAAESGLKQCIMNLVPQTEWLLDNLPSPPLDKMLTQYLPQLCPEYGKLPKILRNEIIEGVEERNKVIHSGSFKNVDFPYAKLEGILLAVQDLLWILDYYSGFNWAINYVRPVIRQELDKLC